MRNYRILIGRSTGAADRVFSLVSEYKSFRQLTYLHQIWCILWRDTWKIEEKKKNSQQEKINANNNELNY